jgi:hypothetical protein
MLVQAANFQPPARLELAALGLLPWTLKLLQHLVEYRDLDAGQAVEARTEPQPGAGKGTSHGSVAFARKEIYESYSPVVVQVPLCRDRPQAWETDFRNRSAVRLDRR